MRTLGPGLIATCLVAGLLTACATPPEAPPGREPLQGQPPAGPLMYRESQSGKWGFQIGGGYSEK
jgi:hypothetical protein